jgi:hypothetical protein
MVDAVAGMLLILAVGMCVVAFPFVLWMLFGGGPRSRHKLSRPREKVRSDEGKKARSWYDESEAQDGL